MLDNNDQKINFNSTPHVIMVVGVNGVGKTTTIGKLAHLFKKQGKKVLLVLLTHLEQLLWINW